jgi:hypothetical protein
MTDHESTNDGDVAPALAVIDAFIDGEAIDVPALRAALDEPEARDYLAELLTLREAVRTTAPSSWSVPARRSTRRWRWLATAAALAMSLTAGYVSGQRRAPAQPAPANVETAMDSGSVPAAPLPTEVIALRPGINWTESSGGR